MVRRPRQRETAPVRIRPSASRRRIALNASASSLLTLTLGFAGLIAIGTALLMLPPASASGSGASLIDALFTATSAACVTGLVVVSSAEHWSFFGQAVIAALMLIGGLGIMTAGLFILLTVGGRISLHQRLIIRETQGGVALGNAVQLGRYVAAFAIIVQAVAFLPIFIHLIPRYAPAEAAWQSVFLSISAFNNAGFAIFPDSESLRGFASDPLLLWSVGASIVLGALSFPVIGEIVRRRNPNRWTLDTRLVLAGTLAMWALGALAMFVFEFGNEATLGSMSIGERISNGAFQAIASRTAGFSSIDFGLTRAGTDFLYMGMMFIGGASGSVAGGIKVNTAMVLALATLAALRGRPHTEFARREIPQAQVSRALALVVLSLLLLSTFVSLLSFTERAALDAGAFIFADVVFETFSAFGTVGLSRGITPDLTEPGKLVVTLAMYTGRLGPLTIGLGLALRERRAIYRYAGERVRIG